MNQLLRLAFCASFLGLFFVGSFALRPAVMEDLGLDFWEWPRWQQLFQSELDRADVLDEACKGSVHRIEAKNQIAFDLIAGRLSLAQAAAKFGELPNAPARMWEWIQDEFKAGKEESMSRHVIAWACQVLDNQPAQAEAVRQRLEGELHAHLHNSQNRP